MVLPLAAPSVSGERQEQVADMKGGQERSAWDPSLCTRGCGEALPVISVQPHQIRLLMV